MAEIERTNVGCAAGMVCGGVDAAGDGGCAAAMVVVVGAARCVAGPVVTAVAALRGGIVALDVVGAWKTPNTVHCCRFHAENVAVNIYLVCY